MKKSPLNQNALQQTKFQIIFPEITSVVYFCQEVILPGITSTPNVRTTPFVELFLPGDKLQYENFHMTFIVDEELYSWQIIYDWIKGYAFPTTFDEYRKMKELRIPGIKSETPQYSIAELKVLTALNNEKVSILFTNLFPVSLSGIKFNTTSSADVPVIASAQFKFQYYELSRI